MANGSIIFDLWATEDQTSGDNAVVKGFEGIDLSTSLSDVSLTGDERDNVLISGGGNDTIIGLAGSDTISAGAGNDTITYDGLDA